MVVFSLLLIVISGGLLVMGIVGSNDMLVIGSIALSLVAAITLFVGVWRQRGQKNPPASAPAEKSQRATPELATEPTRRLELPAGGTGETTGSPRPSQTGQFGKRPDRAAWARQAVAPIAKRQADTPDILHKEHPTAVLDPATAIPQLMSSKKAPASTTAEQTASPQTVEPQAPPPAAELPPPSAAAQVSEVHTAPEVQRPAEVHRAAVPPVDDWRVEREPSVGSDPGPTETSTTYGSERFGAGSEAFGAGSEPFEVSPEAFGADPVLNSHREEPVDPISNGASDSVLEVSKVEPDQSSTGDGYTDPADEPPAELLLSYEERQLAECDRQVFVIDGRPRFHLADCPHLADQSGQPLVISEAAELGFTSCSLCTAATTVLAERK